MPSPRETGGPLVKTGPNAGKVRSKNKDGRWRKKRADAGFPRKFSADVLEFLEMLRKREEDGTLGKVKRKSCDDEIF